MILAKDWIEDVFNKIGWDFESKGELYSMYNTFLEDTESLMSLDSYKRLVRRVYSIEVGETDEQGNLSSFSKKESGNNTIWTYTGPRILTEDQLIDALGVDRDEWHVDQIEAGKWETVRKNKEVHIERENGEYTQFSVQDHGDMLVVPLFRVSVRLTRKVLQPCKLPTFSKIEIKPSKKKLKVLKTTKDSSSIKTALILADAQMGFSHDFRTGKLIPLHDRRVMSIALHIAEDRQPEYIIFNGDFFDFTELTDKFLNSPDYYNSLQPALIEFAWFVRELKAVSPNSKLVYIAGNHEERLNRHILRYSAFAYGLKSADRIDGPDLLSVENLVGFNELGIKYQGNYKEGSRFWLTDQLEVTHGKTASGKSGLTVKNMIREATHSQIVGHVHKFESAERVIDDGGVRREVAIHAFGTMCRVDGKVPSIGGLMNWQQGVGIVDYDDLNSLISPAVTPIKVTDGACIYEKKLVYGVEYSKMLAEDTDWPTFDLTDHMEVFDNSYFS